MILPRIGGSDDDAHGFLVEALETAVALEVFQVAAQRAIPHKLVKLPPRDQAGGEQTLGSLAADRPALPFGECLAQEREIGERVHGADTALLQLAA